jgi:hypothetical protein
LEQGSFASLPFWAEWLAEGQLGGVFLAEDRVWEFCKIVMD